MASYTKYSSGLAERKLTIPAFTGVDQSQGLHNLDMGSSPDAINFIARDGALRTVSGVSKYGAAVPQSVYEDAGGRLFQGFFRTAQGVDFSKIIMALHGRLYVADLEASSWTPISGTFSSNNWTMVNYREGTTDMAIFVNGVNTGQTWDGVSSASMPLVVHQGRVTETSDDGNGGTTTTVVSAGEDIIFSHIALLHERLWGGVSSANPDRIYWSNSFSPNDWEFNYTDSENTGGGFIDVATFDGGRIRALVSAMDEILIFKDKSLHRLNGTYPGEFSLTQVYGTEGTLASRTIVDTGKAVYFLSSDGLVRYTGMSAMPLSGLGDKRLKDIWARVNPSTIETACAVMMNNVIYIAVPLDGSVMNTHVIEYNILDGTYNVVQYPGVDDWLILREGQKETLLFLNGRQIYRYDSGYTFDGTAINATWTSPYISCATLASKKSTGRIYMSVTATSLDVSRTPQIKLTMLSGTKTRTKIIKLKNGHNEIRKRVKIRGRMFRFRIQNVSGDPLTIHRGIEIHIEEDFD